MNCTECEYFHIIQRPLRTKDGIYDAGMAECKKYGLVVDFLNNGKLKRLECWGNLHKEDEVNENVREEDDMKKLFSKLNKENTDNDKKTADYYFNKPCFIKNEGVYDLVGITTAVDISNPKQFMFGVTPIDQIPVNDIKVGDEIEYEKDDDTIRGVVLDINDENTCTIFTDNAIVEEVKNLDEWSKTGRKYSEISSMLRKLRED